MKLYCSGLLRWKHSWLAVPAAGSATVFMPRTHFPQATRCWWLSMTRFQVQIHFFGTWSCSHGQFGLCPNTGSWKRASVSDFFCWSFPSSSPFTDVRPASGSEVSPCFLLLPLRYLPHACIHVDSLRFSLNFASSKNPHTRINSGPQNICYLCTLTTLV